MRPREKARVAIVGGGPAGAGVAAGLARRGIGPVVVIERRDSVGGVPALYRNKPGSVPTFILWNRAKAMTGEEYAARLATEFLQPGIEVWLESQVTAIAPREKTVTVVSPSKGCVDVAADAVVLACGARERSLAERGWITGARPGGVLFTKNLLDLMDRNEAWSGRLPVLLGSDLIAYSAAAKLAKAGTAATMVDRHSGPACSLPSRIYFSRWAKPRYRGAEGAAVVPGGRDVAAVRLADGTEIPCDRLVVCGELVPNSELALMAGLPVRLPSREPEVDSRYRLAEPGWFAAGNVLGGEHGADWCYRNGCRVAASVAKYL